MFGRVFCSFDWLVSWLVFLGTFLFSPGSPDSEWSLPYHIHGQESLQIWIRYGKLFMSRKTEKYGKVWGAQCWFHYDLSSTKEEELIKAFTPETLIQGQPSQSMMGTTLPHGFSSLLKRAIEKSKQLKCPVYVCNVKKQRQGKNLEQSKTESHTRSVPERAASGLGNLFLLGCINKPGSSKEKSSSGPKGHYFHLCLLPSWNCFLRTITSIWKCYIGLGQGSSF